MKVSLANGIIFHNYSLRVCILMKNISSVPNSIGRDYQHMVKVLLMGLYGDGPQLTHRFFCLRAPFLFTIRCPSHCHAPSSSHRLAWVSVSGSMPCKHMCVQSPGSMYAACEATETETTGRGQIWQSWAVWLSEHDFGRQGGSSYS